MIRAIVLCMVCLAAASCISGIVEDVKKAIKDENTESDTVFVQCPEFSLSDLEINDGTVELSRPDLFTTPQGFRMECVDRNKQPIGWFKLHDDGRVEGELTSPELDLFVRQFETCGYSGPKPPRWQGVWGVIGQNPPAQVNSGCLKSSCYERHMLCISSTIVHSGPWTGNCYREWEAEMLPGGPQGAVTKLTLPSNNALHKECTLRRD